MDERVHKIIDSFGNLNQVVDEIQQKDEDSPWICGAFVNENRHIEKLRGKKGKLLNTTGGSVFTVQQMNFLYGDQVFVHQGTEWYAEDNVSDLLLGLPEQVSVLDRIIP